MVAAALALCVSACTQPNGTLYSRNDIYDATAVAAHTGISTHRNG